jgi:hydrophobic/amphiphilic exporter-1 (mainly G- bacteria), HAE1 family
MGLTKVAITRPVFILMLMLASILMGWISYSSMRQEENPEVQFGVLTITTVYPGAGPDELNTLVTRRIEEAVSGVNGLREVTGTSLEGFSTVVLNFNIGTNMDNALNDTRAKVDAVLNQLPREVQKPTINKLDSTSEPVMYLSVKSPELSNRDLRDLVDERISDKFAQIAGVGAVNVLGGDVREIQVQLSKEKLASYGIGIAQVQRALLTSTLNVPSGRIRQGDLEYSVRVMGEFKSVNDLENMILDIPDPKNPQGKSAIIRMKDIATVVDASRERSAYSRLDGNDAVTLVIQKTREGNAVEISKKLKSLLPTVEKDFNVKFVITRDSALRISESIFDLNFALVFGIVLVAAIVYIFLHNFRGTLIVAIAIPICIFITFIAMKLLGFTVNNLSMLALSLAVGVLVDDAIVVLENIFRHLQMGEDPREAAINGRAEIGLAAIAITLADVVVFLPIGFMGGVVGQFFKPLGIGFAVCVLVSLFVSFTITPMLAARWYRRGENVEHFETGFAGWFERRFKAFERLYHRALVWVLKHRWFTFITGNIALVAIIFVIIGSFQPSAAAALQMGATLVVASAIIGLIVFLGNLVRKNFKPQFILYGVLFGLVFPASSLVGYEWRQWKGEPVFKFSFFPPSDSGQVNIEIELPPGASLAATQRVVERVEKVMDAHPDVHFVLSDVGSKGGGGGFSEASGGTNLARVSGTLYEKKALLDSLMFWVKHAEPLRTKSDKTITGEITEKIYADRIAGAKVTVASGSNFGFGKPIQMSFRGDDRELILQTVENIRRGLANGAVKGVINADISSKPGKPEIRAIPDRAKLADKGLSVADLANTLRILYEGNNDAKFRVQGREYDIRVMMDLNDRNRPETVREVPITFVQGEPVFVPDVANVVNGVGVDKIERRARSEEIRVETDLLPGFSAGNVQQDINNWLTKESMIPDGVTKKDLGEANVQNEEMGFLMSSLLIGLVLVYMLLASLYDNLLYPFIIQLAQPQAMVGALLALMITDKTLNLVGFIGIITLVGLVGKNAILLVDYTNTLRERGRSRQDALLEAGPTRLRPIMMTTIALILGILPVALAIGRGSEFRETIGITIIGGITLSTFLTLLVIPCSYTIFDDLSQAIGGRRRRKLAREGASEFEGVEPVVSTDETRSSK